MAASAWYVWCSNDTTSTASTVSTAAYDTTWSSWTTDTSTSTAYTWTYWCSNATSIARVRPTPEQQALLDEQAAEWRRKQEEDRKRQAEAAEKAKRLLEQNLSRRQRASMKKQNFFVLKTTSGRMYRIETDRVHGNIYEVDAAGKKLRSLCVQPSGVPLHDQILAQKLHLEHDEDHIRQRANFRECAAG